MCVCVCFRTVKKFTMNVYYNTLARINLYTYDALKLILIAFLCKTLDKKDEKSPKSWVHNGVVYSYVAGYYMLYYDTYDGSRTVQAYTFLPTSYDDTCLS